MAQTERDFPIGHPLAIDTVIGSPEHKAWLGQFDTSLGESDFPLGHPARVDTPGNLNHLEWRAGVDPMNAQMEAFTGRTPDQARAIANYNATASKQAKETAAVPPVDAQAANDALEQRRKELGVFFLTADQTKEVLSGLQRRRKDDVKP